MLDSLDTLIAFVLIMLVVSLLITIAVQMVSAALNLRGLNLLKGSPTATPSPLVMEQAPFWNPDARHFSRGGTRYPGASASDLLS